MKKAATSKAVQASLAKGGKAIVAEASAKLAGSQVPSCLAMSKDGKGVRIEVLAKPGAKQNSITGSCVKTSQAT